MRMDALHMRPGARVFIGAPADPQLTPTARAAVAAQVAAVPGIREAHLPQCFAPGVSERPAQVLVLVLVLVLDPATTPDRVMSALGPRLSEVIPPGVYLDVWPLAAAHELLPAVRAAGCEIFRAPGVVRRPWWKFWA